MTEPIQVYADSSVYGGAFDDEFATVSQEFFEQVRSGRFRLIVSAVIADEMQDAPKHVLALFDEMRRLAADVEVTPDAIELRQAYLAAGIVGDKWRTDALHVALATVSQCSVIVSWNFKHIVHFEKIPLYNGVNLARGYHVIAIHTPQEVIARED